MRLSEALAVLGIGSDANDEAVRAAYRELVKRHPPDVDPAGFARVRQALEVAGNARGRAFDRVFGPPPLADLDELTDELRRLRRRPMGADGWLEVLRP